MIIKHGGCLETSDLETSDLRPRNLRPRNLRPRNLRPRNLRSEVFRSEVSRSEVSRHPKHGWHMFLRKYVFGLFSMIVLVKCLIDCINSKLMWVQYVEHHEEWLSWHFEHYCSDQGLLLKTSAKSFCFRVFNIPTSTFSWYNSLFYSLRRCRSTLVLTGTSIPLYLFRCWSPSWYWSLLVHGLSSNILNKLLSNICSFFSTFVNPAAAGSILFSN